MNGTYSCDLGALLQVLPPTLLDVGGTSDLQVLGQDFYLRLRWMVDVTKSLKDRLETYFPLVRLSLRSLVREVGLITNISNLDNGGVEK